MFDALVRSLPMAIGLALSPLPMIAIVMLLMTPRAKKNAPFFFFGWILGIWGVGMLIILIPGIISYDGILIDISSSIKIMLGFVVLATIYPIWRKRPKEDIPIKIPKLFVSIDKFGVKRSFLLGLMLSGINIKNIALTSSGASQIRVSSLDNYTQFLLVFISFSIIGSLSILTPIAIYYLSSEKMDRLFLIWRNWLIRNKSNIFITILLLFGILLIYSGINFV